MARRTKPPLTEPVAPRDRLMVVLADLVDPGMLAEIAAADYGNDQAEHLAALQAIHSTTIVPSPLPWEPAEVLNLMRWSEPNDPAWAPSGRGERGYIMRAYCCAVLLRAACDADSQPYFLGFADTVVQLVRSLPHMPVAASEPARDLILAMLESFEDGTLDPAERQLIETSLLLTLASCTSSQEEQALRSLQRMEQAIADVDSPFTLANLKASGILHGPWREVAIALGNASGGGFTASTASRIKAHADAMATLLA
jgi:hypothetical protein